jgi:membrane protein required for colicin V production
MEFTVVDAGVLLIVALSAYLAWVRGLTRETLAIAGWVVAAFGAFFLAPFLEPLMAEIPILGDFLRASCTLSILAAFAVAFALILVVLSVVTPLVSGWIQESALGPIDRGLGFLFGVARGLALVAVLFLLYDLLIPLEARVEAVDASASVGLIDELAETIRSAAPTELPPWLTSRIDRLVGVCGPAA